MTLKEQVAQKIDQLSEDDLKAVAEYLSFISFRSRSRKRNHFDAEQIAALYSEFGDEDQVLAEAGIKEYDQQLKREDTI